MSFVGKFEGKNSVDSKTTMVFDANNASCLLGGNGKAGIIEIKNNSVQKIVNIGSIKKYGVSDGDTQTLLGTFSGIRIRPDNKNLLEMGSFYSSGVNPGEDQLVRSSISLSNEANKVVNKISLNDYGGGRISLMSKDGKEMTTIDSGVFSLKDSKKKNGIYMGTIPTVMRMYYNTGKAGTIMTPGNLTLRNKEDKQTIKLSGKNAAIYLGGDETEGDLVIFPSTAKNSTDTKQASIVMNGSNGSITLGGDQLLGSELISDSIRLNGKKATLEIGYSGDKEIPGTGGKILIYPSVVPEGDTVSQPSIKMDGNKGDIFLQNADCAEEFDISGDLQNVEPGTVTVIDNKGMLRVSSKAYDNRVVGVISGAGDFKPGIIFDKKISKNIRLPLALLGKVNCKVDASYSRIHVGDLLTTSRTLGHAMKATNRSKSFGAVLGKALSAIKSGKGLIPILVSLQ